MIPVEEVEKAPARAGTRIAITVAPAVVDDTAVVRRAEPVTMGVPLPQGACKDPARLTIVDATGRSRAMQARTLDAWPDGSAR